MKIVKTLFIALTIAFITPVSAQTADEIINNYFENTGGIEKWKEIKSLQLIGNAEAQGMTIPIEIFQTNEGKMLVKITFQGQEIKQMVFDGETLWGTNFMTLTAEKMDSEMTENFKKNSAKSFPSPFLDYKNKGFKVELVGDDTIEGTEVFKIRLTQDPVMIEGKEEPTISYYYFDKENFVPIVTETVINKGPMKGQTSKDSMSDYQEVEGLYFPFSMSMGGQPFTITDIKINPEIDDTIFAFPETTTSEEEKK